MADLLFKSLTIRNFKNLRGTHTLKLDQPPGLYHISGRNLLEPELGANGVAKSSLWDALFWNLFGKTIRDSKPGADIEPRGGDKHTSVMLEFARGQNEETLERGRNPNSLHLWHIGPPFDNERDLTQADVPALLGMSEETFRRTVILGQFGTLFLDLGAEAQAKMFSEALDLDIWLQAAARASKAGTAAKQDKDDAQSRYDAAISVITSLTEQIKDARIRAEEFNDKVLAEVERLTTELGAVQKKLKTARKDADEEPKSPGYGNERMAELLDLLKKEPDDLEEALFAAGRKASKTAKVCSKCDQPLPNTMLQATLARLKDESRKREDAYREEMREIDVKRRTINLSFQKEKDAWWLKRQAVLNLERDEKNLHDKIRAQDSSENEALDEIKRLKLRRKEKRAARDKAMEELREAQTIQGMAEFWTKSFKEIRLSIIDEVLAELEIAANRHAENLGLRDWRISFETERESKAGVVSYSFTVLLYPPNWPKPVKWESYSGGESQRWQLAVAFGLSEVLLSRAGISPNIEVLDEPTRGLSPEGISDLLAMLRERALELGRAIYLVDHHSMDRGAFDGTLMVTKRKKGSSFKWL